LINTQTDEPQNKYLRDEYIARINRVIDYIEKNIDKELSLESLANVANFSRYHFHRIFKAMMGETLNQFILRIRIERAATLLTHNPKMSITEIAFDCGFSGSATFARAFKDAFDMPASEWRTTGHQHHRKNCKTNSKQSKSVGKIGKDLSTSSYYIDAQTNNPKWRIKMMDKNQITVEVKEFPELHVAYLRHIGPYQGDGKLFGQLIGKLMKWAGARGLINFPNTQLLIVYHDDPKVTEDEKLRTSVCLTIPKETAVDGEFGKMTVHGGAYAVAGFELDDDEFQQAWDTVYGAWLPDSGYQPDNYPCLEIYHNDPKEHPENKHIVDICIPVKPL
jgi:AraC family transcriptional regulator